MRGAYVHRSKGGCLDSIRAAEWATRPPGPTGTPACTDSISLTRSLSGNAVIILVIGLKIGVCARQKSSKSEKVRVTSIVVVVISSKPSRANNELSASRL